MIRFADSPSITEQTVEIRYKANARVLDHRGRWAADLSEKLGFPNWKIDTNKLEIFDRDSTLRAFASHLNCGITTQEKMSADDFRKTAADFLGMYLNFPTVKDHLIVTRIGVLSKFVIEFFGEFDELARIYQPTNLRDSALVAYPSADIRDVGYNINYTHEGNNFNTQTGPMHNEELQTWFGKDFDEPKVGIYYHVDYFKVPEVTISVSNVLEIVKQFSISGWEHFRLINEKCQAADQTAAARL
jgi:hypothetical protein